MIDKDSILEAYYFRHTCKVFDTDKKIPNDEFAFILETARLSPSSFGMEPWRFIVITDPELKARLKPHCWHQEQVTSCSHLVVILTKTAAITNDTYTTKMLGRLVKDKKEVEGLLNFFKSFLKEKITRFVTRYFYKKFTEDRPIYEWCARQCYIAASSMATSAAMREIDSCFMEGFKKEKVEDALDIDTDQEEIALLLAFGYRVNEQPKKHRLSLEEIVEFKE